MKPETAEAFERLVSTFVAAIEGVGRDVPDRIIEKLASEPLAACEELNEFALSCGAVSDEVDAVLAAIYESMDAADARGPVDEDCVRHIVAAWTNTHVERPVVEPEPAIETEATPVEAEASTPVDEKPAEKPKRRRGRKAKEVSEEDVIKVEDAQPDANATAASHQEAKSDEEDVRPGRRSRAKARKKAEHKEAAPEKTPGEGARAEGTAPADREPEAQAEPATEAGGSHGAGDSVPATAPDAKSPESAAAAAETNEDTLSVDQAVAILGVSRPTIYKLIEAGELSAHKKGRSWRISAASVAERAAR